MSDFIKGLDAAKRAEVRKFCKRLMECASYQFSDKRYEWGIEEFAEKKLGVSPPFTIEDEGGSEDEVDDADDKMFDAHQGIIGEFERIFELGLEADEAEDDDNQPDMV